MYHFINLIIIIIIISLIDGVVHKVTSDEQFAKLLIQSQRLMNESSNSLQYITSLENQQDHDVRYQLYMIFGLAKVIHILASRMHSALVNSGEPHP